MHWGYFDRYMQTIITGDSISRNVYKKPRNSFLFISIKLKFKFFAYWYFDLVSLFNEIFAGTVVPFRMISFLGNLYIGNGILFLSKWQQCNKTRNEFHFGVSFISRNKIITWHQNENILRRPKWNPM